MLSTQEAWKRLRDQLDPHAGKRSLSETQKSNRESEQEAFMGVIDAVLRSIVSIRSNESLISATLESLQPVVDVIKPEQRELLSANNVDPEEKLFVLFNILQQELRRFPQKTQLRTALTALKDIINSIPGFEIE